MKASTCDATGSGRLNTNGKYIYLLCWEDIHDLVFNFHCKSSWKFLEAKSALLFFYYTQTQINFTQTRVFGIDATAKEPVYCDPVISSNGNSLKFIIELKCGEGYTIPWKFQRITQVGSQAHISELPGPNQGLPGSHHMHHASSQVQIIGPQAHIT